MNESYAGNRSAIELDNNLTVPLVNGCLPVSVAYNQVGINDKPVQAVFGVAYSMIWFLSVAFNSLTLVVVFLILTGRGPQLNGSLRQNVTTAGKDQLRRRTNSASKPSFTVRTIFVGSLACSDLLTTLTSLPVTAFNIFTDEWPFPEFVCPSVGFLQAFSIFQSSFTFTVIAVDRFLLVVFPTAPCVFNYRTARYSVLVSAFMALFFASPMFAFVDVMPMDEVCGRFCVERWPDWTAAFVNQRTYGLFVLTLQFGLPTVVTSLCYLVISVHLRNYEQNRHEKLALSAKSDRRSRDRRRRANGMMASMVAAFTLLWMPFNVLNIMRDFNFFPLLFDWRWFGIMYATAHMTGMTTVVWNPVIYAWYNRSIREAVLAFLRHGFRCGGK